MNPRGQRQLTSPALSLVALLLAPAGLAATAGSGPLDAARAAAAVVQRDAQFELRNVPWRPTQGIQVVDLARQLGSGFHGVAYARAELRTAASGEFRFGIAGAGAIQVRIDDHVLYEGEFREACRPTEYAYDCFRWPAEFTTSLPAGAHRVLVSVRAVAGAGRFFLQAFTREGKVDERAHFNAADNAPGEWAVTSPEVGDASLPFSGPWLPVARPGVADFAVNPAAVFKKHSLIEWHYATGVTHFGLLAVADATGDESLRAHVIRVANFTLEHMPPLRRQFEADYAWRGANYRLFRACLLDDTAAPALPYMELLRRGELPAAAPLMETMLDFVLHGSPRLPDGTLCRDEPEPKTVWADDLFMSSAFLVRAADWKHDPRLWDEVVRQVRGFHRRLWNPAAGLYWHGYYEERHEPAPFAWGRANGWMAWAESEILQFLPPDHPGRAEILQWHRQHLTALLRWQAPSGLWHQVLDRSESYEETSASAMFLLAMARGLKAGWLDPVVFAAPARRAWTGLQGRIDGAGVVHGICGGTAIGDTLEHYLKRPQVDHDPRGLGAFLIAALAAADLPVGPVHRPPAGTGKPPSDRD